jgi:tRNA wybutosine-synthesizing protein 1
MAVFNAPDMEKDKRVLLERQGYRIIGEHSAVKLCHWLKSEIAGGPGCYKETFYGVRSHRCLQMTPVADACNLNCLFCWRAQEWGADSLNHADDPGMIIEDSIKAQKVLISGFKGNPRVSKEKFAESSSPNQVAISLTGEPTMYRRLGELIEDFHGRGMTTFLVTNGTNPKTLERLDPLPEEIYRRLAFPRSGNEWRHLMETLELLPSLDTRRVIRHTLVDKWNMGFVEDYAKLDSAANPEFIECKAYMFVGRSRERLLMENMPSHSAIREFSTQLADATGYGVAGEREDSRVALLTRDGALHPL